MYKLLFILVSFVCFPQLYISRDNFACFTKLTTCQGLDKGQLYTSKEHICKCFVSVSLFAKIIKQAAQV